MSSQEFKNIVNDMKIVDIKKCSDCIHEHVCIAKINIENIINQVNPRMKFKVSIKSRLDEIASSCPQYEAIGQK